ncbi:MAG: DUF4962 domain-containing protein [Candidatus Solibacter usitatus]|nr:DUF4962 domain-containing protein [Candidatus Solibacter usitatus]
MRFLILCGVLSCAAAADRPAKPDEWGYRPADGSRVELNPPSLSWVPFGSKSKYAVQMASNPAFRDAITVTNLPYTVYTHSKTLKPGTWYWRFQPTGQPWSETRRFAIASDAVAFPQPTMDELRARVSKRHPRLFARPEDRERLRTALDSEAGKRLIRAADALLRAVPTAEPTVRANAKDEATNQFWWSNRVQTVKALQEAEVLSFAYWVTGEKKYGEAARRFTLALAAWDPDGPTNFTVNCEAAKPMLHRLARAYDWAYDVFSESERAVIRKVALRRALDAWKSGEAREGAHLSMPYGSHANRLWHKLAENAIVTLGETPESDLFLNYAVTKFFAAYPVWSDDDGGWHEGLSYFAGYMSKATWWFHIARTALGIDGFQKPFFAHFGDYAMYSAPPGSPNLGFGDLSSGRIGSGWSFMDFFVRETRNEQWAWWMDASQIRHEADEPVLAFLWSAIAAVKPKPPADLPPSKVFRGTGVAVMNTTLLDSVKNVQVRFKSSPMGRWSHGHDAHNSFTLNAYGEALLVNNVYRDIYGSPFHKDWVWKTVAQNAVLVNGKGQREHNTEPDGRIVKSQFDGDVEYVSGDATAAYEGRLTRALRHILFLKPALVLVVDELEAPVPSTFQFLLHGLKEFTLRPETQSLELTNGKAAVAVTYVLGQPPAFRQWTGYQPEPDHRYLAASNRSGIPAQWHVEAASQQPVSKMFAVTILRPHASGEKPGPLETKRDVDTVTVRAGRSSVKLYMGNSFQVFADVDSNGRRLSIARE